MSCPSSCFKINNPIRNILIPAVVFVLLEKLFGFVLCVSLFKGIWEPFLSLWRPMDSAKYWLFGMTTTCFLYSAVISIFYVKICDIAKKQVCLGGFALSTFLIGRFFGEVYGYMMYPYSLHVMLLGMAHGLLVIVSWIAICRKVFVIKVQN